MKKILIPILLASSVCVGLAGCGEENGNNNQGEAVTITESTDPKALVGEKVDRAGWTAAFTEEQNYTMKSVATANITQNEDTMSESVTLVCKFAADKYLLTVSVKEGNKAAFEAEAYVEIEEGTVSMWQRGKADGAWSDWEGETYAKEDVGDLFGLAGDLTFLKDNYANFSYVDTDKGYSATASGLAAMQEELNSFAEGVLGMLGDGSLDFDLSKFVLKLNGGKPGACLAEMTIAETEASEEALPSLGGRCHEVADEGNNEGDNSEGENTDNTENEGTMPETPAPITGNVTLTQLFYDYGNTTVTRPEDLPSLGEETPDDTPNDTPNETPDETPNEEQDNTRRIRLF